MLLVGTCKKCQETIRIDVGTVAGVEEARGKLRDALPRMSCPGPHVELGGMEGYWDPSSFNLQADDPTIPKTAQALKAKLEGEGYEVRDTKGMQGLITGFAFGFVETNDGRNWDFVNGPEGVRWYYARKEA